VRDTLLGGTVALASLALAAMLRFQLVEPAAMTATCDALRWQGWCALRTLTIEAFIHDRLAMAALAVAILALLRHSRRLGLLALAAASGGLMLYSATLAAPAVLLAALALVRQPTA